MTLCRNSLSTWLLVAIFSTQIERVAAVSVYTIWYFWFLMVLFVIVVIVLSSCYRHQKTKTRRVAVVTTVHVPPHQQQANPYPTPQTHPPPQPYGDPAYPPGYGMGQGPPPADNPFQKAAYN